MFDLPIHVKFVDEVCAVLGFLSCVVPVDLRTWNSLLNTLLLRTDIP